MEIEDAVFNLDYDGKNFTIPLHDGAFQLKGCEWRPPGAPQFVVVYVHGLGSFVSANHDLGDIITQRGGVFLGHGRSPGRRAGCTAAEVAAETELVIERARASFPDLPLFVFGSSLGALCILLLVLERPRFARCNLRGVIVLSPWISNSVQRPITFLESIAICIAAKIAPYIVISSGDPYAGDVRPDYVKKVMGSPLFSPFVTPRLLDSVLRTITFVTKSSGDWPEGLPALFLQGGADTRVDPHANIAWITELEEIAAGAVQSKLYEYGGHNLMKGQYRSAVLRDVLDFIDRYKK
jgi:alpha-beta hydrolase superfamily lysophospholipase